MGSFSWSSCLLGVAVAASICACGLLAVIAHDLNKPSDCRSSERTYDVGWKPRIERIKR